MSSIAQELDRRLQTLDPERAAHCERLVREVLALLDDETSSTQPAGEVRLLSHHFGVNPAIDLNKLGQMAEDY